MIKKIHGGKRHGAGAPAKYYEPTERISFRVPKSKKDEIQIFIKNYLKMFAKSK